MARGGELSGRGAIRRMLEADNETLSSGDTTQIGQITDGGLGTTRSVGLGRGRIVAMSIRQSGSSSDGTSGDVLKLQQPTISSRNIPVSRIDTVAEPGIRHGTRVDKAMDIVDIDKVLDDFELNEDNGYNHNNEHRKDQNIEPIEINKSTTPIPQRINQQSSSSVQPKQYVNVSNVFHSLNEYVDAKTPYVEEQSDEQEIGVTSEEFTSTSSISPNSESKTKFVYEKSLLSGSLMTTSSSSSESSTTDLSPRSITSSVSLIRNSPSLTNDDEVYKDPDNQQNDTLDISLVPKTKTENNDEQIGFSSVSSMCLNDQITSSHSSYSQDIITDESSSLSPLNPSSPLNPLSPVNPLEPQIEDQVNEDIKMVENAPNEEVHSSLQPTKPIGFESTMDDVSDTELESYLQELELEPVLNDAGTNCEDTCANESANVPDEKCTEMGPNRLTTDDSGDDRNQQNADSFSQASTVEFADMRLHSDFEQSPSVENVRVDKVDEAIDVHDEELSEAEVALEGQNTSPYEKPLQRPNSLDLAVKVVVENECHADAADQTPTEQAPPPPIESSTSTDISNMTSTSSSEDFGASISASSTQPSTSQLGKVQPYWIPDNVTNTCMQCQIKFSLIKRRHHCRACGQVLCSACCSLRAKLEYMGDVEARVCTACERRLNNDGHDALNTPDDQYQSSDRPTIPPNPNNPMEYCSVIPPHQQVAQSSQASPISVMVPVGVLKREGARGPRKDKNVMFSDGIRPGCDLTDLDNWDKGGSEGGSKKSNKRVSTPISDRPKNKIKLPPIDQTNDSFIPSEVNALPPIYTATRTEFQFIDAINDGQLISTLHNETLTFAVQRNFYVMVRIVKLSCCMNKTVINFTTKGMHHVNQDEIVILLEMDESNCLPKDIFLHLNDIYRDAKNGTTIGELGFSMPSHGNFLGSKEHGGFLYIRTTFQCLENVNVPENPFLIAILIHRWEVPWAKIFPLRLMLRLGALHRYYPSPHVSVRGRNSVYAEIAQTIINFLADFRTYSYTLPTIHGMYIHMEERTTSMLIPRNRYEEVMKAMNNSSEYILALAANFSEKADGHLVCFQNTESGCTETRTYSTQAVNIQGRTRKVTGASFLVLNGALKSTSGLSGKCSIVEDGLMVQILPNKMVAIQKALREMKDFEILCGPVDGDTTQTEVVSVKWVDNDSEFNIGVVSPIDEKSMKGIQSIKVHRGYELASTNHVIRWTEVFIIQSDEESQYGKDPTDITKLSEQIAKSVSKALLSYLDLLATSGFVKLGLRATLHTENVCYEAGSQHTKLGTLYMKALDNELIPVLHNQATNLNLDTPIVLELIFHILDD